MRSEGTLHPDTCILHLSISAAPCSAPPDLSPNGSLRRDLTVPASAAVGAICEWREHVYLPAKEKITRRVIPE